MTTPDPASLDVFVNADAFEAAPVSLIERAVLLALEEAGTQSAEISVTLLADDEIRTLNRDYLSADRPTDVLAFTLGGEDRIMGDVYIGLGQAARQADDEGLPLGEELVRLALHGTLHVLGHDHPEGPERAASAMFERQERLLRQVLADAEAV